MCSARSCDKQRDPQDQAAGGKLSPPRSGEGRRGVSFKPLAIVAAAALFILLGYFGQPYMKLLGPPERCWELQEIDGKLYKVNPCTGQFRLFGEVEGAGSGRAY